MFYKRGKVAISFISVFVILLNIFCAGCAKDNLPSEKEVVVYKEFSVNYIDVGQGDCIFIRLPDGKNVLIDCGLNDDTQENSKRIISLLNSYSVKKIDYFVLTHPDIDHIGNAKEVVNNFSIGAMYVPYVSSQLMSNFDYYQSLLDLAEERQIKRITSDYTCLIEGENYFFAFLSPVPKGLNNSSYSVLESTLYPTDRQINDLSPIIYFECFGKRFIFTGDASSTQEKIVIENYDVGIYDMFFNSYDIKVNLENIDYLKVSHHGSIDATCKEFLSLLQPKNFIISVGEENFYGHPRTELLELILTMCPKSNIYRTDQVGTITVHKDNKSDIIISTAK